MGSLKGVSISKDILLVTLERRCGLNPCNERNPVSLTKSEAFAYDGFECTKCQGWNDDKLTARDIPDWWEELQNIMGNDELL